MREPLNRSSCLELLGDHDVFAVAADADGILIVSTNSTDSSGLSPLIQLLDSSGHFILGNQSTFSNTVRILVQAGESFFIDLSAPSGNLGGYRLNVTDASILPLAVDKVGSATRIDSLEVANDHDVYEVVAPAAGLLSVVLTSTSGSYLAKVANALNASGQVIASNDSDRPMLISVASGQHLLIDVSSYAGIVGDYALQIATFVDTIGNTIADAGTPISLSDNQHVVVNSGLEVSGDHDVFAVTAAADSLLTLTINATGGDVQFTPQIRLLDSTGLELSSISNFASVFVQTGQQLFLDLQDRFVSTGLYQLTITNDIVNSVSWDFDGSVSHPDRLGTVTDHDVFDVVATVSGLLSVSVTSPGGNLRGVQTVILDASGHFIVGSIDNPVLVPVDVGQHLLIDVSSIQGTVSDYELQITTLIDAIGNTIADAGTPITLSDNQHLVINGGIETSGDHDVFSCSCA